MAVTTLNMVSDVRGIAPIANGGTNSAVIPYIFLNASSEIGAQINSAVTALGAAGGVIVLPNSQSLTLSTTATINQNSISLVGAGPKSTVITCSVAGDCLKLACPYFQSDLDSIVSGAYLADFALIGNGASNQALIHSVDMVGWTWERLWLDGAHGSGSAGIKLENVSYWTERNDFRDIGIGNSNKGGCTTGIRMLKSGTWNSFGHNYFRNIHVWASTGQNVMSWEGSPLVYCGQINISANLAGTANIFYAPVGSSVHTQNQTLMLDIEKDGGSPTIWNIASTNSVLAFDGYLHNYTGNLVGTGTVASGSTLTTNWW